MMTRNSLFVPVFAGALIALSIAVAVAAYGVRVAAVHRGMARAMEQFQAHEQMKGFDQLARIDYWARQHPAFISQVRCAAILGHVGSDNDAAAFVLADRELAGDHDPAQPSNAWQALFHLVSEWLDPIWLKEIGGRSPDINAGYHAMRQAVEATGDAQRIARLNQRMTELFGDTGPVETAQPATEGIDIEKALAPPDFGEGHFGVAAGASIRCYDEAGKHCGDLVPGALVSVTETRTSNGGKIAVCLREGTDASQALLVRTRDLVIRDGDLARLPPGVRSILAEHGRASSQLRQARKRAAEKNPHAANYRKATADYKGFASKVKRLTASRDKAEGNERTRYANELQKMKNQAPGLRSAYEESKRNYEKWKAANSGSIDDDPAVVSMQERVDKAAQQLAPYFDS